jgi:hypothetical protein
MTLEFDVERTNNAGASTERLYLRCGTAEGRKNWQAQERQTE